ncbi:MAG TPA: LysR family transcriptional regulator [Phycicoccus sp.]|jgi:DNA-binding transcriptional LysR family regulator|nr:LysR family transcriptional regulator [Phycicoccus sp.]HQK32346.1 LysR family transcriptional regulator [Phycicoccus sp.]HQV90374.1 LysR family transcriptional regulator [Phycicoccus sp.]HQY97379.1 LysR family transcriptional regulator [Phycicoccus sp.]HRA45733.1 LysR family transcriptional regulator [Phycicoccus sp.]
MYIRFMIALEHLVTLRAVHRTGSVNAAADALGFTPSAVSQQVKRLERQVGAPVLERVGRGVVLNVLGRHLVEESTDLLTRLEALESGLDRVKEGPVTGTVRLAAFSTAVRGLVAPSLRRLREIHPTLDVTVLELDPHDAIAAVATGTADAALAHNWGDLPLPFPDHVEVVTLGIDTADVLVHHRHPLAGSTGVTATDLAEEVWVCAPEGSVCHGWLTHMFDRCGIRPQIRHWAMEFSSQIGLVDEGVCIALVPRLGREVLSESIVPIPLRDPAPTRRVMMTWRASMAPSPAIAAVREALTAECAGRLAAPSATL